MLKKIFNKKVALGIALVFAFYAGNVTKRETDKVLKKTGNFIAENYKAGTKALEKTFPKLR